MLIELFVRYYKFLWLALCAVAFLKVILANIFHGDLQGINGILYGLFKWYGEEEQEMEDVSRRRMLMRVHNLITILLYFMILLVIVATILPILFPH